MQAPPNLSREIYYRNCINSTALSHRSTSSSPAHTQPDGSPHFFSRAPPATDSAHIHILPDSHQGQRLASIRSDIYSQSYSDQPRPECVSEVQHGSQHLAVSLRLKAPYCAINRGDNLPARPCLSSRTDRATTCWGVCIRARERCVSTGWYGMCTSIAIDDDGVRPRNSVPHH